MGPEQVLDFCRSADRLNEASAGRNSSDSALWDSVKLTQHLCLLSIATASWLLRLMLSWALIGQNPLCVLEPELKQAEANITASCVCKQHRGGFGFVSAEKAGSPVHSPPAISCSSDQPSITGSSFTLSSPSAQPAVLSKTNRKWNKTSLVLFKDSEKNLSSTPSQTFSYEGL